jgi:nucleotide-binding universal stress UspA family protein
MSAVPMDVMPPDLEGDEEGAQKRMVEFTRKEDLSGVKMGTIVKPGYLWPIISEILDKQKIDLIVLGTHGRGAVSRMVLGSAAEEIFRHATCPVLTIGPHVNPGRAKKGMLEKILFATDFSAGSIHALDFALQLTAEHNAQLLMIHVVQASAIPFDITDDFVAESEDRLKDMIPPGAMPAIPPLFLTLIGVPSEQILNFAGREDADLIVMGMHKATEMSSHWPNEFAAKVLAGAKCPVLSVVGAKPDPSKHHRTVDPTSLP